MNFPSPNKVPQLMRMVTAGRSVRKRSRAGWLTEGFAPAQAGEAIADDSPVGVKLGDVPPDILFPRVAEKIESLAWFAQRMMPSAPTQ